MDFKIAEDVRKHLEAAFGTACPPLTPDLCPPEFEGDLTFNCFHLARVFRRNPAEIARSAAEYLEQHEDVAFAQSIKGFVNVGLRPEALFRDALERSPAPDAVGRLPASERRRILIEFSSPNTNKPQHLGHARNNSLGMALYALLRRIGDDVIAVNLINDRGIHICKTMEAYRRWGKGRTPQSEGVKGDHFVGDFYVMFENEFRRQVAELKAAQPELRDKEPEELFLDTEIGRAAQELLRRWEEGDPEVRRLWQTMNEWVIAGFEETYRRMGVRFDKVYFESRTYALGKDIVSAGLERGVFHRRSDGAVVIDLSDEGLGEKVVLRSDGTSVYVTQDIGTTVLKQEEFHPDRQVWVVGDEQIYHFRVLFAILRRLGYDWADNLYHLAYGMVNLPSGKMKSREGTVVDADDLFDELARLARAATLERTGEPPEDIDRRAEAIGMAALKFMLLKVSPKTTIMFDPQASVKFEGDTGPYLLYAYARIASMLRKAPAEVRSGPVEWGVLGTREERDLALRCARYGDVLRKAADELDPSRLAGYLLDLAKSFSRFYRSCPVISAESPSLRRARMGLTERVQAILADGLRVLTIEPIESM